MGTEQLAYIYNTFTEIAIAFMGT